MADIGKLAALVLATISLAWFGHQMSTLELGLAIALIIAILLFWIMLEHALKLTRQIADARVKIADLRHDGVRIRNDALVMTDKEWPTWNEKALKWNTDVTEEIKKISVADSIWFSVLDVVPPQRIDPAITPADPLIREKYLKLFREHDYRLKRLNNMIRDLWGRH
ncbi:MAG: hypothetical protein ACRECF_05035 [Methyloceanibacter sp.]